jgi:ubiquitin carboxyl-terminal hydrolase 7
MYIKHSSKTNDFRVWVEIQNIDPAKLDDPPVTSEKEHSNDPRMCIFLKHFDPTAQTLLGVTHVYVRKKDRVHDLLLPQIYKMMNWPESPKQAEIQLFEEIKPSMIDQIKPKQTFESAEIQDGDIICFQKTPTIQEAQALRERGLPTTAAEFYSYMTDLIKVKLLPKVPGAGPELTLIMSKKMTYDDVSERVAKQLNVLPTHLQFRQAHNQSNAPKAPLKRAQHGNLAAMLSVHNYYGSLPPAPNMLYYETLEISLAELETKRMFKFTWLPDGISKEEACETLVPKTGTISDLIPYLVNRYNLDTEQEQRIRFFTAHGGKFQKQLGRDYPVLQQDYNYVYAELMPEDELHFDPETSKLLEAFHFHKEPSKTHSTAVPFKFVIKKVCIST